MGEELKLDLDKSGLDTTVDFKENTNIDAHMAEARANIQTRLRESFESLPEVKITDFTAIRYLRENPQSIIFVPEKDMNMFPVLMQEAKIFRDTFKRKGKLDPLTIRDHEFEHLQKAYELGFDIQGMGLIVTKYKGKPLLGGFVATDDKDVSLRDRLRLTLAPRTGVPHNVDDMISSAVLTADTLIKAKSPEEFGKVISDAVFVISERYLPKKVHSVVQKVIK